MAMVDKLAYIKRRTGLTSEVISQRSGIPLGTVNKIFSGQTHRPSPQSLDRICQVLQIPMRYLLDDDIPIDACIGAYAEMEGVQLISSRQNELLHKYCMLTEQGRQAVDAIVDILLAQAPSAFPAGPYKPLVCCQVIAEGRRGSFGDGFHFRHIQAYVDPVVEEADFAILLSDHSMSPVYTPGTILALKRRQAGNNHLGVFLVNREAFVRKLSCQRNKKKLVSVNLEYKDILLSEHDEFKCLGTVVGAIRNYYWL